MLIIRDIMTESPVTVAPQVTLRDAVEILARYGISGMPVVEGRIVIGTLSARDIVDFESTLARVPTRRQGDGIDDAVTDYDAGSAECFVGYWDDAGADAVERVRCSDTPEWDHLADHVVADAMSAVTTTFRPSDSAEKAARYMDSTGTHRAVIVEDGVLVGILSTMDITRAIAGRHVGETLVTFTR
jgi:CBS domain-containing protein